MRPWPTTIGSPCLDDPRGGTGQAVFGARAGTHVDVDRLHETIEPHVAAGVIFRHAGLHAENEAADGASRFGRGIFEAGELVGFVDDAQAVDRIHEEQGGVADLAKAAQRFDQIVRGFEPVRIEGAVFGLIALPTGKADAQAGLRPASRNRLRSVWLRSRGWPIRLKGCQSTRLNSPIGGLGIGITLIAGEQRRRARHGHDQQCFLEPRIVARGPADIGHMLAVAIDDDDIEPVFRHAAAEVRRYAG